NDQDSLMQFCETIADESLLALDTEFIREKTYYPQLCLIQVAAGSRIACVDPLAVSSLEPLLELIYDPGKTKLFHAARQDLEIFYQLRGSVPRPVFDTQVAATLLGYSDQSGYATLVSKMLGVELDKDQARTDWSQRPLNEKQIQYAANDVRYLIQLYPLIIDKLSSQHRIAWLDDDFESLVEDKLYQVDPESSWRRVSGHNKLKPRQLARLQQLAAWREQTAMRRDRPRRWILGDDVLINLAQQHPANLSQLEKIRGIKSSSIDKFGDAIIKVIMAAEQIPEEQWPRLPKWQRTTPQQDALVDVCMACMKQLAFENEISPGIVCNRKEMEKLVMGDYDLPLLNGWRRQLIGEAVLELLQGRKTLSIEDNRINIKALDT
ncbi:MAG: ribonuclease D, partial [Thioalkalispiraceae bacterium]